MKMHIGIDKIKKNTLSMKSNK